MHRKGKASLSATLLIIFSIQLLLSTKIVASETVSTYHPNGYNLLGATTRISGTLTHLQSDNSDYMTFRSYFSGIDASDFVDNNTFDVDSSADKGTHANFSAQQYGPDLISDTLTEENTGGNGSAQANYELDLEVQWTDVDYDESNELLCVYGGTMDAEDIRVDVWNGIAWQNLLADLTNGWNNVSVSSHLNSPTFAVRFKGGKETGDVTQDSWNIDVTLLRVWSKEYTTEVEFTGSADNKTWAQLDFSINSAWTIASISVTLQLYNYSLGSYPTNGNGSMNYVSSATTNTDETKNQTITVNPTHFRNATGYWKFRVKGVKIADTPFDFKADLIRYEATYVRAHAPFGWVTTILFALPVVFGLLFLLTAKRRRKKKTDEFSESFGMTHQQMIGKKMLLEIDPTSDYHKALLKFASEARRSSEPLFVFTSINSALHSTLSEAENVKFFVLTSNTSSLQQINDKEILLPAHDLSVLLSASLEVLRVQKEKTINMLFDNISSVMIRCGFQKTYNFMHFLLEATSSPKATVLFVYNPAAHDPVITSSIRGLFHNQLAYTKSGPKVGTL